MDARPGLLGTPLGQFGLGAIALVIGGALLFTLIGAVSAEDTDDATPTAGGTTDTTLPATDDPTGTPTGGTSTDGTGGTDGTEGTDGTATDASTPTDPATDAGTEAATTPQFDPGEITIQVLDAVGDGGATHGQVMDCLGQAGYDDLIPNSASRIYTSTTVFFTAGEDNQGMAQQVATALGVGGVEEKPGNLSDSVPVHIVVGEDGGSLC